MSGLYLHCYGLIYIIMLAIIYFSKKRLKSYENNLFIALLLLNGVGLILHIASIFTIPLKDAYPLLNQVVTKSYIIYLLSWLTVFTIYVYTISFSKDNKLGRTLKFITISIGVIFLFLILLLPLYSYYDGVDMYTYGPVVDMLYVNAMIYFVVWITCIIANKKNRLTQKYIPLIFLIIGGGIVMAIQFFNPEILLMTSLETLVVLIMYHTIENPDMKMIEQLNIARDQADKANNAKSEFLSSMSHEIRTPLNAIVGFSQALLEENIPESAQEEVNDIMMASDSLLEIVNGILDISKIEANKLEIIDTEYELNKTLKELVSLTKTRIGEKPIEFRSNIDPSIPEVLYGDHTRLKQVILNLLTNAAKYTNEGYIEFKISSVIKNDVCRLIITVEDTGIGIKKEKINNLFTKFDRLEVEKQTTIEGTGLGLAITKKLVELMNGKIVVQSVYGKGSKFTVAIDQKIVANKKIEKHEEIKEASLDLTGKTLLVVDDNKVNLKVAERLLKSYNVTVKTLSSGIDAIDTIKNGEVFDLILMDDMMPKMSGTETMHHLKELEGFNIPVVALTANAISGMKEKYLSEGFDDYLSKPIQKPELNEVLAKYLK